MVMKRLAYYLLLGLLTLSFPTVSQDVGLADVDFMDEQGETLTLPFIGGLRAPQVSTADLDLDGLEDIVVFDRDGSIITPLIRQQDGSLSFDPSFRNIFPGIRDWMLLRDYNNDGIKDIFCSPVEINIPGVAIYKGVVIEGQLSYELVRFPEENFDAIVVPVGSARPQLFASIVDLPSISDLDGDGDLDILSFEPSGFTIHHFRNMSMELGFGSDTLIYELAESCYGGMIESGFSEEVSLSSTPGDCASSGLRSPEDLVALNRHAGSTITSIDLNGDNLEEALLGDVSYQGIVALTNEGTLDEAFFTAQETQFPAPDNDPVDIQLFNTVYHEDLDGDGQKEIVVLPSDIFGSQSTDHSWLYEIDVEENEPADIALVTKNFLVEDMLLIGPNSSPEFWDFDNDGLKDLLIGSSGLSNNGLSRNPAVLLYKNVGTPTKAIYQLVDDDFGSLRQFNTTSLNFDPTAGDLDGDGDDDIVVGDNGGLLYYLENLSGQKGVIELAPAAFRRWSIKVSAWASPEIFDFNGDGLGDLIIGELNFNSSEGRRGSFTYFPNIGTVGDPDFNPNDFESPNDLLFGRIDLKDPGSFNNYAAADMVKSEDDLLLVTGTSLGAINIYSTSAASPQDSFSTEALGYANLYEGRQSKVSLADIDDDELYEMAIGNRRGGLAIYETDLKVGTSTPTIDIEESELVDIYPNPASDYLRVKSKDNFLSGSSYKIVGADGKLHSQGRLNDEEIDISRLNQGVHWIEIRLEDNLFTQQFIKVDP